MPSDFSAQLETLYACGVHRRAGTDALMFARAERHVHDADLVVQALLMKPRPDWLKELVGLDLAVEAA